MTVLLPTSVANANWFLLAGIAPPLALVAVLLHPTWRTHRLLQPLAMRPHWRVPVLWTLLFSAALATVLGIALEAYYAHDCPNSAVFHSEIESLARFVYDLCAREKVPFWVMFGNLLFVLRGDTGIPVGDTDSDVGVEKQVFLSTFGTIANFTHVVRRDAYSEFSRAAYVQFLPDRDLVQIYIDHELRGPHADIWLYTDERHAKYDKYAPDTTTTTDRWLVNNDRTIRAKRLPYNQVLPLQPEPAWFLGAAVGVPQNATFLATAEYGASFLTPVVTRLECVENVLNGYTFYDVGSTRRRITALLLLLAAALALAGAYVVRPLRHVLVRSSTPADRPWVNAREKEHV